MEIVYKLQQTVVDQSAGSIPESQRYSSQPTISYCWYWGCSKVCTPLRYNVNRWWLIGSLSMTFINLINIILAAVIWRKLPSKGGDGGGGGGGGGGDDMGDMEEQALLMTKPRGRRKRIENPSGLLF